MAAAVADFDPQRMAALKRVYAEIILNAVKECGERVMASERKSALLEQKLGMAKDEAVAMLVRLKSFMDAKMKEVEKVNTCQGRRIKELEVELAEAKVTIDCLRSNLTRVKLELENKKNNKAELSDELSTGANDTLSPCFGYGPINVPHAEFDHVGSLKLAELSKKSVPSEDFNENPDLASMILRNKKPELYRNGCTQRILAVEQNILAGSEAPVEECKIKNKKIRHQNGKAEAASTINYDLASKKAALVKKLPDSEVDWNVSISHATTGFFECFSRKRRSRRKRCSGHPVFQAFVDTALKYHKLSDADYPKTTDTHCASSSLETICATFREGPCIAAPYTLSQVSRENNMVGNGDNILRTKAFDHEISHHTDVNKMITKRAAIRQDRAHSEDHINTSLALVGISGCDITPEEPAVIAESNVNSRILLNGDSSRCSQIEKCSGSTALEHETVEDLDTCELKENHIAHATLTHYRSDVRELCKPSDSVADVGGDRIVKYTFQRKRKRESSCSKNDSLQLQENDTVKQKKDEENSLLEPLKPSLLTESSRENRRLAQVARQLISLSEKRWC